MNLVQIKLSYLIVLCLSLISNYTVGQLSQDIQFATIDNSNGLPSNTVTSIAKDDLGFVWIGTSDGLCRYEGKKFVKIYRANDPKIEGGLENSSIRALFLDSKKNLWIGTRLGGLTRFHQPSDTWKTFKNQQGNPQSISNDEILTITEDKRGRIWIGTEDGLNIYHPEDETFTSFKFNSNKNSINGKAILTIHEDKQGLIWIGTWGGGINLLLLPEDGNISEANFRQFTVSHQAGGDNIWKIYQDRQDHLWVGTRGAGLFLMELPEDKTIHPSSEKWQPKFHQYIADSGEITSNHIEDIYQDVKGTFWVATDNGLNCVWAKDFKSGFKNKKANEKLLLNFKQHRNHPKDKSTIVNNNITTIFEDTQGTIWLGTYSGVSQYNWFTNQFDVHELVDDLSKTPNTQNLYVDKKGVVWFGYGTDGVIQYDLANNKKRLLKLKDKHLEGNYVFTLFSDNHQDLYLGTKNGVVVLDMETNRSKIYPVPKYVNNSKGFLFIRTIFCDQQDRIWVATLTGLYIIDKKTGVYQKYIHDPYDPNSISDNSINQIYQDSYGDIWISSFNGLNKLIVGNEKKLKFKSFKHDPKNPKTSILSNQIISLTEANGILYIGSNTGLGGYDLKKHNFINYSINYNKKNIQSLVKTTDGDIWASTSEGILLFNNRKQEFNQFDKKDGLGDIIFQANSNYKDHKGYIYFGSREGITRFHPANLTSNEIPPPVHITDIRKMSPDQEIQINATYAKEINIEHDEYYLSIDYAALNYNRPEKNKYAFKLEGFEENWNHPIGKTSAVYTNLDPGSYTFRVKAANNDGVWNKVGTSIKIIKRPAFWQTWWFKVLGILLIGGLLYWGMKYYTRNIKTRNKILQKFNQDLNQEITQRKQVEAVLQEREQHMEHLVKVRTQELEVKNQEVKKLLSDISQRNEKLEVEIAKRTQNLILSNKNLKRSNKDLEQFAYIASHDLQEPLRVVGNFIGLLRRRYETQLDEQAFQYIDFAVDGVQRMSEQIKSVLIFSKVSQRLISYQPTDVNEVIKTKLHDLSTKIDEKKVSFKIENMPEIICEKTQLAMVFYNLISNAIKFNKSEKPLITISNHSTADNGFWHFSVKDNGIGIEPKYQEKIFEIFSRLHNKRDYEGTGIGLALCQKIIYRHDGKIWIESVKGQGTTFHFTISKQLAKKNQSVDQSVKNDLKKEKSNIEKKLKSS